jgi:hypothetical protein
MRGIIETGYPRAQPLLALVVTERGRATGLTGGRRIYLV